MPTGRRTWGARLGWVGVFVAAAAIFGFRTDVLGFVEPDEARYAAVAQAMLETGDLITPRFNGFVYLDKPPLLHWTTAASFAVLGLTEFAARLSSALAGAAAVAITYALGCRAFGSRAGLAAAVVLGSSVLWFAVARVIRYDMLLTLAVTVALWGAWTGSERRAKGGPYWVLAALAAGLGVLVKGPVGLVLPACVFLGYLALTRQLGALRVVPWLPCLAVFAAVTAPWLALCERANPGAVRFMLLSENLARAAGEVGETHAKPAWYYLAVLPAGVMPWAFFLVGAVAEALRGGRRGDATERRAVVLLLLWVAVPLVLFSIPRGKLPAYILPALPAAALLVGRYLALSQGGARAAGLVTGAFLVAAAIALQTVGASAVARAGYAADPFVPLASLSLLVAGLLAGVFALIGRGGLVVGAVAAGALATLFLAVRVAERAGARLSERALAQEVDRQRRPGERVVSYGRLGRGVVFYLGVRPVVVGNTPGEYDFPANRERLRGWVYPASEAERLFSRSPAMVGTARLRDWQELRSRLPGRVRLVATAGKNVVFRTVPAEQ